MYIYIYIQVSDTVEFTTAQFSYPQVIWVFHFRKLNKFFSINMNYTLNRKYNKYSSPFDIYLTKWGKNEKYEFYIY